MEWVVIAAVVLWIFGAIGKSAQKATAKREAEAQAQVRRDRIAASRQAILDSGDLVAIHRLNVMEGASSGVRSPSASGGAGPRSGSSGPGVLGTAAAVAGGIVAGNALTSAMASAEMEAALAELEADFAEIETAALEGDLAEGLGDEDLSFDI